jgi:phytoene synthase
VSPDQYCQQKAAASGSSFYYSFLFLPRERRLAITALYAFCREVDDVVDEASDPQVAAAKLAWWRAEIARLFAGKPQHPVMRAMQPFR